MTPQRGQNDFYSEESKWLLGVKTTPLFLQCVDGLNEYWFCSSGLTIHCKNKGVFLTSSKESGFFTPKRHHQRSRFDSSFYRLVCGVELTLWKSNNLDSIGSHFDTLSGSLFDLTKSRFDPPKCNNLDTEKGYFEPFKGNLIDLTKSRFDSPKCNDLDTEKTYFEPFNGNLIDPTKSH